MINLDQLLLRILKFVMLLHAVWAVILVIMMLMLVQKGIWGANLPVKLIFWYDISYKEDFYHKMRALLDANAKISIAIGRRANMCKKSMLILVLVLAESNFYAMKLPICIRKNLQIWWKVNWHNDQMQYLPYFSGLVNILAHIGVI